jgi:dolichyl-phosphate beta-glucosyltransferase
LFRIREFLEVLTGIGIYDSQCGLKVIRRDAFASIEEHLKETRFALDVELTLLLLANGFSKREVPINWKEVPGSKVSIVRDNIRMFSGVLQIRQRFGTAAKRLAGGSISQAQPGYSQTPQ